MCARYARCAEHFPKTLELPVKKIILPIGVAALLIAACGKKEETAPTSEATPPAATAPAAAPTPAPTETPAAPATTEQPAATEAPKQ